MNLKHFYVVFYFIAVAAGQEDDRNVCYRGVKPKLDDLINLYKKSPSISNLPTFPDINSLINEVEDIISNITNLENTFNKSQAIRGIMNNKSHEVTNLKTALSLLKSIRKGVDEINQLENIHNQAVTTCSEASDLYEKLRKDVNAIKDTGSDIKAVIDKISKRIEDINKNSLKVKHGLDSIYLPESLFQQYICDINLQSRIQDIIDSLRNIADILRREFKGVIEEKLKEIENNSDKLKKDVTEMEKSLNEEIPKTDIKTTDATNHTIDDLKKQIQNLKDKLKNMNLDQTSDDFLINVKQKLKNIANEYETILKHLFSKENMDKAAEELEIANKTLQLVNDRNALKAELDEVKKHVDTLKKGDVCSKETVSVEG